MNSLLLKMCPGVSSVVQSLTLDSFHCALSMLHLWVLIFRLGIVLTGWRSEWPTFPVDLTNEEEVCA